MTAIGIHIFDRSADKQRVSEGDVLFRDGDPGDAMYAVIEGEIAITVGGQVLETVGPGGIFGELALIDSSPRSGSAEALTDAVVVKVGERQFTWMVQEHPTFAISVMRVMADRLRSRSGSP